MPAGHNEQPAFDELCVSLLLAPSDSDDEVSQAASDLSEDINEAILEITSLVVHNAEPNWFMRFDAFSSEDEN